MCSMTDAFRNLAIECEEWHKKYMDTFKIDLTEYEREHFVNKWHEHQPWDADPVKTAEDCIKAILKFRSENGKR